MKKLCSMFILLIVSNLSFASDKDTRAAALAENVMNAMGGKEAYDNTRYLTWRFFGQRFHVWDKHQGDVRIEDGKGSVVIMNINTKQGKAWQDGVAIENPETLSKKLISGYKSWVNDSYWLVMPYKLQDPGAILRYTREDTTIDGRAADVLTLTFADVGVTPNNKYEIFIDKERKLVTQWTFYPKATDEKPRFTMPWADWEKHGAIMLSGNRGKNSLKDIAVLEQIPASTFTSPEALPSLVK